MESKKKCYKGTYKTERDSQTENKLMVVGRVGVWEGIVRDFGKVMYTLQHLK